MYNLYLLFLILLALVNYVLYGQTTSAKTEVKIKKSQEADFIMKEDGTIQTLDEARKQARGEADLIHRYNQKYYAGEYLVYDCKRRYYACVDKKSFEYCQLARKKSRMKNHSVLACAPFKSFKTLTTCLKNQYDYIHKLSNKLFCINTIHANNRSSKAFSEIDDKVEIKSLKDKSKPKNINYIY